MVAMEGEDAEAGVVDLVDIGHHQWTGHPAIALPRDIGEGVGVEAEAVVVDEVATQVDHDLIAAREVGHRAEACHVLPTVDHHPGHHRGVGAEGVDMLDGIVHRGEAVAAAEEEEEVVVVVGVGEVPATVPMAVAARETVVAVGIEDKKHNFAQIYKEHVGAE
jgi:hypothetical protein